MKKINWKAVIITFLVTGLLTTIVVGSITAATTWYFAKNKYENTGKVTIERLQKDLDEIKQGKSGF